MNSIRLYFVYDSNYRTNLLGFQRSTCPGYIYFHTIHTRPDFLLIAIWFQWLVLHKSRTGVYQTVPSPQLCFPARLRELFQISCGALRPKSAFAPWDQDHISVWARNSFNNREGQAVQLWARLPSQIPNFVVTVVSKFFLDVFWRGFIILVYCIRVHHGLMDVSRYQYHITALAWAHLDGCRDPNVDNEPMFAFHIHACIFNNALFDMLELRWDIDCIDRH